MAVPKAEGNAEAVPMGQIPKPYSINAIPSMGNITISDNIEPYSYLPYKAKKKTKINPCGEGLEDPVLLAEASEINEGVDPDRGRDIRIEHPPESNQPGCCRRYSCCFPLIIITLVWLMMFSAEAFEHCQDCISGKPEYKCNIEPRGDYYCKSNKIQICCYYDGNTCTTKEYPNELDYKMGEYFNLSMYITIIMCLIPCILPCGVPYMLFHDCKNSKFSFKRQTVFDILCTLCFVCSSLGCSLTAYKYYKYPNDRCSSNSDLFGIAIDKHDTMNGQPNIWIMSQTTYSSFFGLILLCSFSICGTITLILQAVTNRKKKVENDANQN